MSFMNSLISYLEITIMKKIILILFLLLTITSYGQDKMLKIEYEIFYNTDLPNTQYADLYVNDLINQSIYIKRNKLTENKEIKKEEDNSVSIKYNSKNNFNFFDFKSDSLITVESIYGNEYLINETIPKLKWELIDENKLIDSILVSKAICEFRGRKYIAWYSLDYPLKYGPWKLQGLPGLIFEVYDETKRYNWLLKKISYENFNLKFYINNFKKTKKITINEYPKIKYDDNTINEKLLTKLPRGSSIISSETKRNGLEIKFEWEE